MTYETKRLYFRPWTMDDAEACFMLAKDEHVGPACGFVPHSSLEKTKEILDNKLINDHTFCIIEKESGDIIGNIGIDSVHDPGLKIRANERELGFWLGYPYWNKGFMTEALKGTISYCFNVLNVSRLWCGYYEDNPASKRVQEKNGFIYRYTRKEFNKRLNKEVVINSGSLTARKMYQISTLSALALGYSKPVITVKELLQHGDTGLGTYEDVDGEMILLDGNCYRADEKGNASRVPINSGVPFSSVSFLNGTREFFIEDIESIDKLKEELNLRIEEDFGLNSMHMVKIDGSFRSISARSESGFRSHHVELKDILKNTQKEFFFKDIKGSLVCVYYPDYMEGINAAGWHFHFISDDKKKGGHVFDLQMERGHVYLDKISRIDIQMPTDPAFDTYALKSASNDDIKKVEQGKK